MHILAARTGQDPDGPPMVVRGTVLNAELTAAMEYWAWKDSAAAGQCVDEALRIVADALPGI